jgi:translation initiation factor 3 subunit H
MHTALVTPSLVLIPLLPSSAIHLFITNYTTTHLIVTGVLLGLDDDGVLECTNCFPNASSFDEEDGEEEVEDLASESLALEGEAYQLEMMKAMRDVNADNNCIGWYKSSYMGTYCDPSLVQVQFAYQSNLFPNAVVLVLDPIRTSSGSLALKAFRLTKQFMSMFKDEAALEMNQELLAGLDHRVILEELPVSIKNSHLAQAYLFELKQNGSFSYDFERLALSKDSILESQLEALLESLDDYTEEIRVLQNHERTVSRQNSAQQAWLQKRKSENAVRKEQGQPELPESDPSLFKPIPEPPRLDSLLIAHQIGSFCDHVNKFAGENMHKLFLAGGLHQGA